MSLNVENALITEWSMEAQHALQRKQTNLMSGVRVERAKAKTHKFHVVGAGTATVNRSRHTDINPMNVDASTVDCVMKRVEGAEWIEDFDALRTNLDLRREYTQSIMMALGRKWDEILVDDGLNSNPTAVNTSNALNKAGLIAFSKEMTASFVPIGFENRFMLVGESGLEDLLNDTTLTSRDFVEKQALTTGVVDNVMGFTLIYTDNSLLPVGTAGTHRNFAWWKKGVGVALGESMKLMVERVPQKNLTQVLGELHVGACSILPDAVFYSNITD